MAVRITIGSVERNLADADSSWINQQVNGLRRDNLPVCVRVSIQTQDVNIMLSTSDCPAGPGGSRQLRPSEASLFDLWAKLHLNESTFSAGNLIAFLHQIK